MHNFYNGVSKPLTIRPTYACMHNPTATALAGIIATAVLVPIGVSIGIIVCVVYCCCFRKGDFTNFTKAISYTPQPGTKKWSGPGAPGPPPMAFGHFGGPC